MVVPSVRLMVLLNIGLLVTGLLDIEEKYELFYDGASMTVYVIEIRADGMDPHKEKEKHNCTARRPIRKGSERV